MTDARLAPPARPPAPESAVACRSGGFQARLGPCVPWKPPDIDPIGHPHVVFRVDWTTPDDPARSRVIRCFRHQLLLPRPYLVLTKPLRLDIQCQRGASVKIGWKYLDD